MTKEELKLALKHAKRDERHLSNAETRYWCDQYKLLATQAVEALAQPEQEPVAMKFKIYKPTVPDPMRQGINNALLPWVYDQDRNSGFDATMWVTPVATLPPQRKPLTDEEIKAMYIEKNWYEMAHAFTWGAAEVVARAIEAAHGIKENES